MDLKYIYHGNMVSRPTTFLEVLHCWSLFWWNYCKIWFFPYVPVSDVLLLWSPQPVFFLFLLPLHFSHKPFWFWHSPALGTCTHKSHKLAVRDSCKCVHLHSFVLTTHSSSLSCSLCGYSQCDQNRDEFVFYFILIFTTSSVSSTPHLSALFNCYVNSVRIVTISCQNLSS